ncbi:TlpA family protein disulfide reductase [Rhodohalobacter halophilus]|uniref:TlpA family protein disulfide reductase n=1 Tax=Rhodohalobacter halophilus TaxID=1812810 RepID=UPI00083FB29B|nr:redoxin domain-containing protein [Rhodohalobacter halophilus]
MKFKAVSLLLFAITLMIGCSGSDSDLNEAFISGRITVDENVDSSGDYSDIELIVSFQRSGEQVRDTLFYAQTDEEGYFSGKATFERRDLYPVVVSRNQNTFGILNVVFADGDSVTINAQLPNVNETAEISSAENDVLRTFQRIERNFNRVAQYINIGAVSDDSVTIELQNWSDLYWQIYQENPGTLASELAGNMSVSILSGWNDSLMVERAENLMGAQNKLRTNGRSVMIDYYTETEGLDRALSFLNRVENLSPDRNDKMTIQMDRIELLYDSSRTQEASDYLNRFKESFSDVPLAMEWAENIGYDIEFLAPGSPFPNFTFETISGELISGENLSGSPYIIEFTRFDNRLYQQQFDRTVAIYQIYSNFGLDIITVPIATSPIAVEAFFTERDLYWHLVQPNSFDTEELIERFNISRVPTRFLVDTDGTIIRRYVGDEFREVVRGLQNITSQNPS